MDNHKAFQKLEQRRFELEEIITTHQEKIHLTREEAKKLPKGSAERKLLMTQVQELGKDIEYKHNLDKLKIMNFCINTCFYGGN